ncbi:MAG: glycosyltransferase family 4 protein [Rhodospirillales bacterium]|nr:glycosyltransferase family 4 protein [Rhodospirillales bacterium]
MRVLVWQWGRRGAGPRFAAALAGGFAALPGVEALLSLSTGAEILLGPEPPRCDLPMPTYAGVGGLIGQALRAPVVIARLTSALRRLRPDLAVCAMPGPLDLLMRAATRRAGIPLAVIVHDAEAHPGDGFPLQFRLQRALVRRADRVLALSEHVVERLRAQRLVRAGTPLLRGTHPPFDFGVSAPSGAHDGPRRVLSFGRLLPYKGLDLLAEALRLLGPRPDMVVRVVGQGPESAALAALRALPGVTVENRWVPEQEVGTLLAWADIVVLPYREASQSGVAAAALAAGRRVVATRVGGIARQLEGEALAVLCAVDGADVAAGIAAALAPSTAACRVPADRLDRWAGLARLILEGQPSGCAA